MFEYLDKSCSTSPLASEDAGTGTGWGTWCVCSPAGRRCKCTGCIPGPSPKLGATCLHESTSCHCINTLRRNGKHLSIVLHVETIADFCEEHLHKIKYLYRISFVLTKSHLVGVSAAAESSRWSPKPLWGWVYWGSGLWEKSWPWVEWHGRTAPCPALQNTGPLNASFVDTDIITHSYLSSIGFTFYWFSPLSDSWRSITMNHCPHLRLF